MSVPTLGMIEMRAVSSLPRRSFSVARPNNAGASIGFDGPLVER
jgi:hypothetical protein